MLALLLAAQLVITAPPARERVDQALLIGAISASSIALGLTMTCTTAQTCREVNPIMAHWLGESPTKAVLMKSALVGGMHYAAWRLTHGKPKTRTLVLAALFAVNLFDAVHDVRVMRQVEGR